MSNSTFSPVEVPATSPEPSRPRSGFEGAGSNTRRFRHRTEFSREKDVLRHLHPWVDTYKPAVLDRNPFSETIGGDDDVDRVATKVEPSPDTALAAFAQLGALRLKARRCLISLLSTDTEFVLADVSRTMALQHGGVHDNPRDGAWIGTCSFPLNDGMHGKVMQEWRDARRVRELPDDTDHFYTQGSSPHWHIVSDMRYMREYQRLPLVQYGSWIRFCASVPLRSAQGSVIGALTVLDDRPRHGICCVEMAFLEDLSDTIIEHLHSTILRAQNARSERLIQGLGLFNSGKNTLRDWWLMQYDAHVLGTGRLAIKGNSQDRQAKLDAEFGIQLDDNDSAMRNPHDGKLHLHLPASVEKHSGRARLAADPTIQPEKPTQQSTTRTHNAAFRTSRRRPAQVPTSHAAGQANFDLVSSSANLYARASNLLRETMGADGVVFITPNSAPILLRHEDSQVAEAGSELAGPTASHKSDSEGLGSGVENAKPCEVHSFSTRSHSSLAGHAAKTVSFYLPERQLHRLIKRYPRGFVFYYDVAGLSHTTSDEENSQSSNDDASEEQVRRRKDGQMLGKVMKGAREIAIYPLWDESSDRWRSCIFAWNKSPVPYFNQTECLTYLRAFGHSIVAEISRLSSIAADNAKGTFISSMSHELRSPLHGVMAGVEFLLESELDDFQREMTRTISTAGTTLLDTVNHILDYSKISNHKRVHRAKRITSADPQESQSQRRGDLLDDPGTVDMIDLARLTEDVVETTVSAYRSQHHASSLDHGPFNRSLSPELSSPNQQSAATDRSSRGGDVSVTLDIPYRRNWIIHSQPGGWTRIITNLLGNALKYTPKGSILLRLQCEDAMSDGEGEPRPIQLTIEDTGIGITQSFQEHSLFVPFRQEDPYSPGAGLGLSIVWQIAKEMDASLAVISTPGQGTKVTLNFMAKFISPAEAPNTTIPAENASVGHSIVDHFHLIAPETGTKRFPTSQDELHGNGSVDQSVLNLAHEWLHCKVFEGSPESNEDHSDGSFIYAITENRWSALEAESPNALDHLFSNSSSRNFPVLVLGSSIRSLSVNIGDRDRTIVPLFVHQPIGPHKLMRAVAIQRNWFSNQLSTGKLSSDHIDDRASDIQTNDSPAMTRLEKSTAADGQVQPRSNMASRASTLRSPPPLADHSSSISSIDARHGDASAQSASSDIEAGRKVLLVEDNEVNMKLLTVLMNKLRMQYHCAVNGRDALDAYTRSPTSFSLILMDISMPIMDGFTATARIRDFEQSRRLKRSLIVALTGDTNDDSRARAFDCGVDEYYAKPVRMKELKDLIKRIET